MSVTIRLTRAGRRHIPFYHIGVFDSRTRRDGRPIEQIGFYDPLSKKESIRLDAERARHWLEVGARPSTTMASILEGQGLSSALWAIKKTKKSKPKVATAQKRTQEKSRRSVKKRKKSRTANSKTRAEKKAAKK